MIYEVMITVATFDILPTDDMFPLVLAELPEEDAYTDKFDRLNYGSVFTVMNMGTLLIIFLYYVVLYSIYPCVRLGKNHLKWCNKLEKKLNGMLFWNHAIVFIQEGFIEILIGALINFKYMVSADDPWGNWNLVFNNIITIVLTAASAVLCLFLVFFLYPRFGKLRQKSYKEKYEGAYEMIQVKRRGRAVLLFPLFFFVRRILLAVAVVHMLDYPSF